jgi:DNA-binding HxlR family transcriptional regulator
MEEVIQPRRTVGPPPYHHRLALRRLERSPACAGTSQETTMLAGTAWCRPVDFSHLAGPGMSPTMVSWVVRHLEQSGLIGRRKDPHDRRAAVVAVTPAAERLLERIRAKRIHAQSFPVAKHSCGAQELLRVGVLAFDGIAEHLLGRCS